MTMSAEFPLNATVEAYDEVRQKAQTGDLVLFSGSNWFSRLIGWLTCSDWSHIGIVVCLEDVDRVMVLESIIMGGVHAVPLSSFVVHPNNPKKPYKGRVGVARHADVADTLKTKKFSFFQEALDLFGRSFDVGEMVAIFMRLIFFAPRFAKLRKRRIVRNKKYLCSEYVDECYRAIGIETPNNGVGFIAPVHFAIDPKVSWVARLK